MPANKTSAKGQCHSCYKELLSEKEYHLAKLPTPTANVKPVWGKHSD